VSFALYLDEHVDVQVAKLLRSRHCEVQTTQEAGLAGRPDEIQLRHAASEGRAILTYDTRDYTDLFEVWLAAGYHQAGIILSSRRRASVILDGLLQLFDDHPSGIAGQILWLPAGR
jgi:hypothetical protein